MAKNPAPGSPGPAPRSSGDSSDILKKSEREVIDRRSGLDRRRLAEMERAEEARAAAEDAAASGGGGGAVTGLERRRGPGRRLSDSLKQAEEGEMSKEQFLFLLAIDSFKRANQKTFPSWTDVLEVIRLLGYRKTCSSEISLPRAEDWKEKPDAPANVRRVKPGE